MVVKRTLDWNWCRTHEGESSAKVYIVEMLLYLAEGPLGSPSFFTSNSTLFSFLLSDAIERKAAHQQQASLVKKKKNKRRTNSKGRARF